jgi:uncharacterized YccA/Bax inhibitor family protein
VRLRRDPIYGWLASGTNNQAAWGVTLGGVIAAAITSLVMFVNPRTAPVCSPIYALGKGALVGMISWFIPLTYHKMPDGLIFQAVLLTFGILFCLLAAYATGMVRLGSTATKVITVATAGICFYYLAVLLLRVLGFPILSLGWSTSPIGIGFSIFVVVIASLNLVMDFQFIEAGVQNRAPRYMEWYGAFALLVTLVWLYIEVLRLLAKVQKR